MARDTRSLTISRYHEIEDCEALPEEVQVAARQVICAHAVGETLADQVADAEELMRALGIHPAEVADFDYLTGPGPVVTDSCPRITW